METIRSLRPSMSREQLFRAVLPTGGVGRLRRLLSPVRGVAEVYVPFHVFRVEIRNAGRTETKRLAIDAVKATLDVYSIEAGSGEAEEVTTRNVLPPRMSTAETAVALKEKVRRMVFRAGFFALRDFCVDVEPIGDVHVPYWAVMVGSENDLKLKVFDAVRGRPEGAKVRSMIREWLRAA